MQSKYQLINADCLEAMKHMDSNSVDSIITDCPYGISFMGVKWDTFDGREMPNGFADGGNHHPTCAADQARTRKSENLKYQQVMTPIFAEALRVAKPGAHLLAFGGTRTYHRLACAIEDAGWEVRDQIAWIYGSGMPKGLNIGKAIDKAHNVSHQRALTFTRWLRSTGVTAEQVDKATNSKMSRRWLCEDAAASIPRPEMFELLRPILPPVPEEIERLVIERAKDPNSDYAKREVLSTKKNGRTGEGVLGDGFSSDEIKDTIPFSKEAQQWEGWNSALKPAFEPIVLARKPLEGTIVENVLKYGTGAINIDACRVPSDTPIRIHSATRKTLYDARHKDLGVWYEDKGRYPANLLHDGSPEVLACFPDGGTSAVPRPVNANRDGEQSSEIRYTEKGNTNFAMKPGMRRPPTSPARFFYCAKASRSERGEGNIHPTIKPLALMRWCVTLVAPPDSVVLDPFMGSGSTGIAALQCGCRFVGIEREPEYMAIAEHRIATALDEPIQDDYKNEPTETADCPDASDKSPRTSTIQQGELDL